MSEFVENDFKYLLNEIENSVNDDDEYEFFLLKNFIMKKRKSEYILFQKLPKQNGKYNG